MRRFLVLSAVLASICVAEPALAAGVSGAGGFLDGLFHPVLGFDHLLAMVAVGLLSVQLGGRAVWTVPAAFVLFLAIGGVVGLVGVPLPQVEGAIAFSVVALGLAIALRASMPIFIAMAFVGFFAVFHGHAHGAEVPKLATPAVYVLGFMLASAFLHLVGVSLGVLQGRGSARALLGAGIGGIGVHMVLLNYGLAG
ncbi:MAG: HupE/UreJ family protein [Neomegalonema sp.]|nr:HupE/UreJ family protein [Neomegalonema sp.]